MEGNRISTKPILNYSEENSSNETDVFLLKNMINSIPTPISFIDTSYRYVFINKAYCKYFNKKKDEIEGHTAFELFDNNLFSETIKPNLDKCFSGNIVEYQHWFDLPENKKKYLNVQYIPYKDNEQNIIGAIVHVSDLTDIYRVNDDLKDYEEKVERYLSLAGSMIISLNTKGEITLLNEKGYEILGYDKGELIGKNWFDTCLPSEIVDKIKEVFHKIMIGDISTVENYINPILRKDGEKRLINWHNTILRNKKGDIIGLLSSGKDVTNERKIQDELIEKEEKFKLLFQNSLNGIVLCKLIKDENGNPVDYIHIDASPSCEKHLGMKKDHLINKKATELIGKEAGTKYAKMNGQVVLTNRSHSWVDFTPEPYNKYLRMESYPIKDDFFAIIFEDITDKKIATDKLKQTKQRLQDAEKTARIGNVEWYVKEGNGYWSSVVFELYERDASLGVPSYDEIMALHHPDDAKKLEELVNRAILEKIPYKIDLRTNLPSGIKRIYHAIGKPIQNDTGEVVSIKGTVQDVTDHVRVRKKLKESEEKIQKIFHMSSDLICEADINTASFTKINPAFTKILGYSEEELLNNSFLKFVHPDDREKTISIIEDELQKGNKVISFSNRYQCKDGSYVWIDWNSHPIPEEGFTYAIGRDITEKKKYQERIVESERKYRRLYEAQVNGFAIFKSIFNDQGEFVSYEFIDINPAYERITGVKREEVIGKDIQDVFPGTEQSWIDAYGSVAMSGIPKSFEMYHEPTKKYYFCNVFRPWNDTNKFCVAFNDVTDRIKNEKKLRENEEKLKEAQKIGQMGSWVWDVSNEQIWWSDELYYIFEISNDYNLNFENISNMIHPEDREKNQKMVDTLLSEGVVDPIFLRIVTPSNNIKWIKQIVTSEKDIEGNILTIKGVIQDVTETKRIESELFKSTEILNLAMNGGNLGYWDWDIKTGNCFFSDKWLEMIGYNQGDLENHYSTWEKILHPDDKQRVMNAINAFFKGDIDEYRTEFRLRCKNGEWKWILAIGNIFDVDKKGNPVRMCGVHLDIDKQKRSDERLKQVLRTTIVNKKEMKLIADFALTLNDLKSVDQIKDKLYKSLEKLLPKSLISINAFKINESPYLKIEKLIGLDKRKEKIINSLLGSDFLNNFYNDIPQYVINDLSSGKLNEIKGGLYEVFFEKIPLPLCHKIEKLLNIKKIYSIGLTKNNDLHKSISIFCQKEIDIEKHVIETLINHTSTVIEQRDAEKVLAIEEKKYRKLFEDSNDAILLLNNNGIINEINNKACELFSSDRNEVVSNSFENLTNYNQDFFNNLQSKLKSEKYVTLKTKYKVNDNNVKVLQIGCSYVDLEEQLMQVIIRDITKESEFISTMSETLEELEKSKQEIIKQNEILLKLNRAKNDFLNNTSHELRTPMTAMKGYVQLLKKEKLGPITEKQKNALDVLLRNTDRLDNLVQDILDTSRLNSGAMKFKPSKTNLNDLIHGVISTMRPAADMKNITLDFEITAEPIPEIILDKNRIIQVLTNLINNAIKFSKEQSDIKILVDKDEDNLFVKVHDNGIGIPKDKQKNVFDMFYQIDSGKNREFNGAGLGLSISRGIILNHGGRIWVNSEEGKGSTFTFSLPINNQSIFSETKKIDEITAFENKTGRKQNDDN